MITTREYEQLKTKVDQLKAAASRAEGAQTTLLETLKKDFGCGDLEQAKKKLAILKRERDASSAQLEEELAAFKQQWSKWLGDEDDS